MAVNKDMEQAFLSRLTEITEANLNNEQFGVGELAKEFGRSRSYIHRRLKTINNQSISQFIRSVRLEKAMEMLRQNKTSASEIAYMVGFSSPTYFNHCFHKHYGFPPGEVKNQLLNEETDGSNDLQKEDKLLFKTTSWFSSKKIFLLIAIATIIFTSVFYFLRINEQSLSTIFNLKPKELSIIVLPFKNLTDNPNNQWLADGFAEDILNNLCNITSLGVISRTSAEQFRESTMAVPEIAKKMKVNYVLEGSVRLIGDQLRITTQLIDANSDKHLWSQNFDSELGNIIGVQGDVALKVAQNLNVVLSDEEVRQIKKIPTQNSEAYAYYLQARFLLHKANDVQRSDFDKKSVMNCIQYYEKAIAKDPNFAKAYAGLANAWFNLTAWGWLPGGFQKARALSMKAIEIDPECAEAHAVLGSYLVWGERNFEKGGKELKMAVKLNPNFSTARQWYAQYLMITGPIEEARKQMDHALVLESYFWVTQNLNSWIFYFEEKYDKALEACMVAQDYNPNFSSNQWLLLLNFAKLNEGEKTMLQLQKMVKQHSGTDKYDIEIQQTYKNLGIDGLFIWLIEINKNAPISVEGMNGHPFYIAWWNAILGNKDESIHWLQKNVNHPKPQYHYFNLIVSNPDFDILRTDPRFKKIVDQIGLTPYHTRKAK